MALSSIEAGLLLDASEAWYPMVGSSDGGVYWPGVWGMCHLTPPSPEERQERQAAYERDRATRAKRMRIRRAFIRLTALGLLEIGYGKSRRPVVKRTELGAAVVARRHNELHAIAERVGTAADSWDWIVWERDLAETEYR